MCFKGRNKQVDYNGNKQFVNLSLHKKHYSQGYLMLACKGLFYEKGPFKNYVMLWRGRGGVGWGGWGVL